MAVAPNSHASSDRTLSSTRRAVPAARLWCAGLVFLTGTAWLTDSTFAQPPAAEPPANTESDKERDAESDPYRLQIGDDEVTPFVPDTPRTKAEEQRLDAVAHYMTGKIKERRDDLSGAYDEYQQAIAIDPDASVVYKSLVPLAFRLRKLEEAEKYALKAVQLDPDDFDILRRLGVLFATRSQMPRAIEVLEQAIGSEALGAFDPARIILSRDLVILYGATGDLDSAAKHYETIFDALRNPRKYDLNYQARARLLADELTKYEKIGKVFLATKRYEEAVKAFELAASSRSGNPQVLDFYLAIVYAETDKPQQALASLDKYFAAKTETEGSEPYELLAKVYEQTEQSDKLLPRLEGLAADDPRNGTLKTFLAEQYVSADRLDDAGRLYREALDIEATPERRLGLAQVLRRQREYEAYLAQVAPVLEEGLDLTAVDDELTAAAEDEEFPKPLAERVLKNVGNFDLPSIFYAGVLASRVEANDEAEALLKAASEQGQRQDLGRIYSQLGQHYLFSEQFLKAADIYDRIVRDPQLGGQRIEALYRLSQAREYAGQTEKALIAIRRARREMPRPLGLLNYQEAWIYYHARRWEEAITEFAKVIEQHGDDDDIRRRSQYSMSNAYIELGKIDEGLKVLEDAYKNDPDDPGINNDLGYLYADNDRNLEQAKAMISKAIEADPENGAYLDSMAWVLYKLGDYEQALSYQERALAQVDDDDATLLDHYGDILHKLDRTAEAIPLWKRALAAAKDEAYPDEDQVAALEQKLKEHAGSVPERTSGPPAPPLPED